MHPWNQGLALSSCLIFGMQLCLETVKDQDALLVGAVAIGRSGNHFRGQCPSQEQGAQARQLL